MISGHGEINLAGDKPMKPVLLSTFAVVAPFAAATVIGNFPLKGDDNNQNPGERELEVQTIFAFPRLSSICRTKILSWSV
jgi:hypothetical protein